MIKKALPFVAIGMTIVAGFLAVKYNQSAQIMKAIKAKNASLDTTGMTPEQQKIWAKI